MEIDVCAIQLSANLESFTPLVSEMEIYRIRHHPVYYPAHKLFANYYKDLHLKG
jgi:hypothetical protein